MHNFLAQVEKIRETECVSRKRLVKQLHYLLEGNAKIWHRQNVDSFVNWDDLKAKMEEHFLSAHNDKYMMRKINDRMQDIQEPIALYIQAMITLYDQLIVTPPVDEQVYTISFNALPEYQSELLNNTPDSINSLMDRAIFLEATELRKTELKNICKEKSKVYEISLENQSRSNTEQREEFLVVQSNYRTKINSKRSSDKHVPSKQHDNSKKSNYSRSNSSNSKQLAIEYKKNVSSNDKDKKPRWYFYLLNTITILIPSDFLSVKKIKNSIILGMNFWSKF